MGITDNMLRSESIWFVSRGNCNQSDGKSVGGQPIENGTQSINLEPLRMPSSEASKALNDKVMVESVNPLEHLTVNLSNDPLKMLVTSAVEDTVLHKYPPRRRISAVRDFPSFCGRNAPPLQKDGCTHVVASIENKSLVLEKPGIEARLKEETMKTDLVQMLDKFQDGDAQLIRLQRSLSAHIADKVTVAQEKKNHNEFEASSDNVMKGCQEELQHTVVSLIEDILENYGLVTDEDPKSSSLHIAPLEEDQRNQAAAFMEESSDRTLSSLSERKTQMSEEDSERFDFTSEKGVVVQGLMAAQSCLWRHGKAHCKSKSLVGGTAAMKAGEDTECFNFTSEKGVVQGLMAAQSCPWRQGKAHFKSKSLVGGTAGMKRKKNGLSHKPKNLAGDAARLAWQVVKKSKKFKVREGLCVPDISHGKEVIPICAVNTLDNEKPPAFQYITRMINLDLIRPSPPKGCGCTNGCTDSVKCACVIKNGGEIPFNHNGAIVEEKSLVYECGPACKCPPSCHNRVSQNGIKLHLEIFKTESRGWGVRSLNSIPSGSFICEYLGELLEEKEADQRTGNDEYLFDIGNQYDEGSLRGELCTLMPEAHLSSHEVVESSIFTIDAASFGNIGRFINHSCSPNLYAQNVLYDHEDKRIPHIMLFAAEYIPPLQELTYHYNYVIDQVLDSDGNIKKKNCYCGSSECTGRLY